MAAYFLISKALAGKQLGTKFFICCGILNVYPSFHSYASILDYGAVFVAVLPTCFHIHPNVIDYIYSAVCIANPH